MRAKKDFTRKNVPSKAALRRLGLFTLFIAAVTLVAFFSWRLVRTRFLGEESVHALRRHWKGQDYARVYDVSSAMLYRQPFNFPVLVYHGYSSFFLAIADSDTIRAQTLLDEAIISIRQALLFSNSRIQKQLCYMLGKAYFYKDKLSSSYYYADLVVDYLNRFGINTEVPGINAKEISEILGLSYADLGMAYESVIWFTKALSERSSDALLLAIAEQYQKLGEASVAEQYLYRISGECKDEKVLLKGWFLLGEIYTEQERYADAEAQFQKILEKSENSADAYYGLGVVYEKQGDIIKARSEWRRALRIQENHLGALKKMSDYR